MHSSAGSVKSMLHYEVVERIIKNNFGNGGDADFLEIGVANGIMEKHLIATLPLVRITCIDILGNPFNQEELKRIKFIQGHSSQIAEQLKGEFFDFIYIDGDHDFYQCRADIIQYSKLLKKYGIIGGHDYSDVKYGVMNAVDEIYPQRLLFEDFVWIVKINTKNIFSGIVV